MQVDSQTVVPILGMHRSGTSMFTRMLNLMGLEVGDKLLGASADNPHGFWEHEGFLNINMQLLQTFGANADGFVTHDKITEVFAKIQGARMNPADVEALKKSLAEQFSTKVWGFKDPRTVITYGFWQNFLTTIGVNDLKPVVIIRHPSEVAQSLKNRGNIAALTNNNAEQEHQVTQSIIFGYNSILKQMVEQQNFCVILQEQLVDPDRAKDALTRAANYIGLATDNIDEAMAHLDKKALHSHTTEIESAPESVELYEWFVERAK